MKIIASNHIIHTNNDIASNLFIMPDNVIVRNNEPFYFPDYAKKVKAYCGFYTKLTKLGKCFDIEFSKNYYKEIGLAVNFFADNSFNENGKPCHIATSFDKSFSISNELFEIKPFKSDEFKITINEEKKSRSINNISELVDKTLSVSSLFFTIKIGDLLFIALDIIEDIKISDCISITYGGIELNWEIR